MFSINVSIVSPDYHFDISGCSYIGRPRNNTVMYMTKKIEHQLDNLSNVKNCLIYVENTVEVPDALRKEHCFVFTGNPQFDYSNFVSELSRQKEAYNKYRAVTRTDGGFFVGENVSIGANCMIEQNCYIGHDVRIGDNAHIMFCSVIRNAVIGDNFIANEHAVIGANAFTMAHDESGHIIRIPTLGSVSIGNNVEVGALNNISCGTAGETVLGDNVKLDAFVHVGHDVRIDRDVEIPAGVVISGFVNIGAGSFIGVNASLRNRINIGEKAFIGMGAVVTKDVEAGMTVVGNPAKPLIR